MNFKDFINTKYVKKTLPDKALIKSLLETAESDILFLKKIVLDNNSARKVMTNYYDVLRSVLEAIASKFGYKIYSHEIFAQFLKHINEHFIAEKFDRFRKIRNNINYYGKNISILEAKELVPEITRIIEILKKKYLSD